MSKEELLAIVSASIDGQGNQIDIAGVLANVLREVIEQAYTQADKTGDLAELETDHKSDLVSAINEIVDIIETPKMEISMLQSSAERKKIYDLCTLHLHLAKNIEFRNINDGMIYRVNGYKVTDGILHLHTIMSENGALRNLDVQVGSNGSIAIV